MPGSVSTGRSLRRAFSVRVRKFSLSCGGDAGNQPSRPNETRVPGLAAAFGVPAVNLLKGTRDTYAVVSHEELRKMRDYQLNSTGARQRDGELGLSDLYLLVPENVQAGDNVPSRTIDVSDRKVVEQRPTTPMLNSDAMQKLKSNAFQKVQFPNGVSGMYLPGLGAKFKVTPLNQEVMVELTMGGVTKSIQQGDALNGFSEPTEEVLAELREAGVLQR